MKLLAAEQRGINMVTYPSPCPFPTRREGVQGLGTLKSNSYLYPMFRIFVFIAAFLLSLHSVCRNWVKIYGQGQNAVARNVISDYDRGFTFRG
jgi:hypothetical protein